MNYTFDGLGQAAAVLLFHWDHYFDFLNARPDVCNKLACFARSMQDVNILKLEFVRLASFGLHLVEPFHILIKSKDTTHSFLYDFYKSLDDSFIKPIKEVFFGFVQPHFPFEKSLFDNVMKHSYDPEVVEAVQLASRNLVEDAIRLANYMLPTLRKMFALQRQDYEFSTHTPQFPVRSQATQIDDVPVHNLSMEQYCGKISQRLDTLKTVEATSRSHILQKTQSLVQNHDRSFRSYAEELKKVQVLKLEWSKRLIEGWS